MYKHIPAPAQEILHSIGFNYVHVAYYTVFCVNNECSWIDPDEVHLYTIEGAIERFVYEHLVKLNPPA